MDEWVTGQEGDLKLLEDFVRDHFAQRTNSVPLRDLDRSHMAYALSHMLSVADDIAKSETLHSLMTMTDVALVLFVCEGSHPDPGTFEDGKAWIARVIKDAAGEQKFVRAVVFGFWVSPFQFGFCAKILNGDVKLAEKIVEALKRSDSMGAKVEEPQVDNSKLN